MPQRILGIDLGAWSVKGVLVEDSFRGFQVLGVHEVRTPPGTHETRYERQLEALKQMAGPLADARADAYVAALSGESAATRFITLPYSDTRKVEQTIGSELADVVPFDIEETVYDHTILKKNEDGSSLSLAAVVPKPEIEALLERLKPHDIDPKYLSVDVLQLYNLYTHFLDQDASKAETPGQASPEAGTQVVPVPGGPPEGRLLLDVGHERTLALAATADGIAYVRVIRAGGAQVTRAIADAFKIDFEAAEAMKHGEGFVGSSRHPPPDEAAQRMSDAVATGLAPLFRELRLTLQSIRSEKRVRVARIDLLGGGSKIRHFENRLAEELNVPVAQGLAVEQIVETQIDASRRPAYALALSYGLRAVGEEPVAEIELRRGDFQFAGQLQHVRDHLPLFAASVALLLMLLGTNVWAAYFSISRRERAIDQQFCSITKSVVGREICEPTMALSVMQQPAGDLGNVKLPTRSALNIAAELSARIPEKVEVKIEEMDITPDRVRISGETTTYDAVDQIVTEYAKDTCYKDIKKGKLDKKTGTDKVEFQLTIHLECP